MYTFGVHHEHPSANLNNNNETAMKEVDFLSNKFEKVYFVTCCYECLPFAAIQKICG